jgi:hypothetical protein
MKEIDAPNCGRENDLIAFLYGELNDAEARTFQHHVRACAACSTELASFRQVRESVVAWRDESLGGVISPVRVAESSPTKLVPGRPSALAAWREFFNLAPLWMKSTVAVASILLCLFAGLAIARWRETPSTVVVADYSSSVEEQINARVQRRVQEEVERRVREEIDRFKNSTESRPASTTVGSKVASQTSRRRIAINTEVVNNSTQKARRPLSRTEREQLAADLRLVFARNESELDLLDDGINQ